MRGTNAYTTALFERDWKEGESEIESVSERERANSVRKRGTKVKLIKRNGEGI